MIFWFVSLAMAALVGLLLGYALWRGARRDVDTAAGSDVQVYRAQLAEVDRDVARGVVPAEDAERARTEIARRILKADTDAQAVGRSGDGPQTGTAVAMGVVLLGGSVGLYTLLGQPGYGDLALADRIAFAEDVRKNRPGQQMAEDSLPEGLVEVEISESTAALLDQLRTTVAQRPDDLRGHRLLAQVEANAGNFSAAAQMQAKVLDILEADATLDDAGDYAELLVLAAGGYVSPEAEALLRVILAQDSEEPRARYYIGLMMYQTGRPDVTFRLWDGLLRRGPEDAPWIGPISTQIMDVAQLAGVTYAMPQIGKGAQPGPTAEDIEAAAAMTPQDRMEMIGSMVSGLSDRLATQGGPPQDWARLITSLSILGDAPQARAVYDNAIEVFAKDEGALDMIRSAGSQAGVAE